MLSKLRGTDKSESILGAEDCPSLGGCPRFPEIMAPPSTPPAPPSCFSFLGLRPRRLCGPPIGCCFHGYAGAGSEACFPTRVPGSRPEFDRRPCARQRGSQTKGRGRRGTKPAGRPAQPGRGRAPRPSCKRETPPPTLAFCILKETTKQNCWGK